jgi:hypothetical protein
MSRRFFESIIKYDDQLLNSTKRLKRDQVGEKERLNYQKLTRSSFSSLYPLGILIFGPPRGRNQVSNYMNIREKF